MSYFALIPLLPVLAYCLVQTFRDCRSRSFVMAIWGGLLSAFIMWMVVQLAMHPGY
jgi:hypothetical protein